MIELIPNTELIEGQIPSAGAAWKSILAFSMSFNGYKHWGSFKKCREVAKEGIDQYRSRHKLTRSLTDLRTCLFYEARRWQHFKKNPTKAGMEYIRALVEEIRVRVQAHEFS
jgi:hypothetical protein